MLVLDDKWRLLERPLNVGASDFSRVLREEDGWIPCSLPCDVRMPLIDRGIIKDPVVADYCFDSEWVENRSWWFTREFNSSDLDTTANVIELVIESIDAYGDVFLNGSHIGHTENCFYPFILDIKPYITEGVNVLALRVTTGLEQVSDKDLAEINSSIGKIGEREDFRRYFLRKPEYTVGWDWAPRIVTCGIVGAAHINCYHGVVIRGVKLETKSIDKDAVIAISIEAESLDLVATSDADYDLVIMKDGAIKAQCHISDVLTTSGINFIDMQVTVPEAELWWPNGHGEQPLYDVEISVSSKGIKNAYPMFRYGIRTISLDCSRIDESNRMFALKVNGVNIFCKGANWIPADSIYARVTAEKYRKLVSESKEASFNMLRIWGGGLYEHDYFYDACDEFGILVWQDFAFGCSVAPDHLEWFQNEVAKEMDYQTKRLRNRASLALWCGNNENHWIYGDILSDTYNMTCGKQYGLYTGNVMAVRAIRNNCQHIPYWNSSPYGGEVPNDSKVGDAHHWHDCMMHKDMEKRIEPFDYDKVEAKFVSEYGFPAPCELESIEQYHDGQPLDRNSRVWNLHNNTYEKQTVAAGIEKHYVDNAMSLPLEAYIRYAGMVQSEMLGYSLESFRFKLYCSGGLFWMYNDAWGEVGWTIIDYYLRRKVSFYGVKRAFEPAKLIIREKDGTAIIVACNDTDKDIAFTARVGYISFDGKTDKTEAVKLVLSKHSRAEVLNIPLPSEDYKRGIFAIVPDSQLLSFAYLRTHDKRELILPKASVQILSAQKDGNDAVVKLTSSVFAHGVYGNAHASDNYFDLLPGQIKEVRLYNIDPAEVKFSTVI